MSVYPIVVRKITMQHRTHDKDYHQVLICTNEGRSVVINRWGKRGKDGQREHLMFDDAESALDAFLAKQETKQKDGYLYDVKKDSSKEVNDDAEFQKAIGPLYWFKMASHLQFLVPGIDMKGAKDPDLPTWEADGKGGVVHKGYQPKHKFQEYEPTVEDKVAENENWGMF